ncbi:MAG: GlsB/YeaQ/YmgE family stress response membrane protein [Rhodanobacter sp.]
MTATGLIIFLLIGAIAGWLAGLIVRGFGFGLLGNIVVGIIGAFLAGWLLPMIGVGFSLGNPIVTEIVYAMIGAIVLLVIIGLIKRA